MTIYSICRKPAGWTATPTWTSGSFGHAHRLERGRLGPASGCARQRTTVRRRSRRPRSSDGVTVWIDMRDARTSHRASRIVISSIFLSSAAVRTRTNRPSCRARSIALFRTPHGGRREVPFQFVSRTGGYRLEAFVPASALNGFDPEQNPRLGIHVAVHDQGLGEASLSVGSDFPGRKIRVCGAFWNW